MQVISLSDIEIGDELGRGAYGRVFKVKYLGVYYAAKQIHSVLLASHAYVSPTRGRERNPIIQGFVDEIKLCSTLSHPNIVQYRGIFYEQSQSDQDVHVPVMLMELMDSSLHGYLRGQPYVSSTTKMSILHDVSLGLYYLHSQKPPIIHRDLSPNNVMIKSNFPHPIAKISDLGVAKSFGGDSHKMTKAPGTLHFMPPECLDDVPQYGPSMDTFSYGGVALFVINQEWPEPTASVRFDPETGRLHAYSEVQRRHRYLNFQDGPVKQLMVACLSNDPGARPSARRIEAFLSSFKNNSEKVLAQATQIIVPQQKDEIEKVKINVVCYY